MILRERISRIYHARWFFGSDWDDYTPEQRQQWIAWGSGSVWDRQSKPMRIIWTLGIIVLMVVPNVIILVKLL